MSEQETPAQDQTAGDGPAPGGNFVWHDLMSRDPEASKAFYTALFGWDYEIAPNERLGPYPMIRVGEKTIGGILPIPADQEVPSHWIGYVQVADVEASAHAATRSGGEVCVPVTEIPDVGHFAVLRDPTGATVSPFKSAKGPIPEAGPGGPGTFCWDELLTVDTDAAAGFYTQVFPWRAESMEMGPMTYHLFKRGEGAAAADGAGMMQLPPEAREAGAPSHWLPYVAVESVDAAVEQAQGLGATCHCPPMDIPSIGRFAVLSDPTSAVFAVFQGAAEQQEGAS